MPVNVVDIEAREEHIQLSNGDAVTVYSHRSISDRDQHIVRTFHIGGGEVNAHSDNRGMAMLMLADYFEELGKKLRQMAFEQEGAIRIPK